MNWKIPLADIDLGPEEQEAVSQVLSRKWLTMGEETGQFEEEFAAFIGAKHAIAVTNATAALHLACVALDLKPGDEVIVPSLTFVATANAVRYTGAVPVFADIRGEHDLNISPESIEEHLTPRTRAVSVVHYGGFACDMTQICELARQKNLSIIEDAAHAPGSEIDGRMVGLWGEIACFSFFSNKNMTTGEGGMLTTQDDRLAQRLRILRSHGMTTLTWDRYRGHAFSYDVVDLGYNYRIDEIRAALGRVQLKKLAANNARRRELSQAYWSCLASRVPEVSRPFQEHPGISSAHLMPVLLPRGVDRLVFMESMKAQGIQTSIHYPPIHQFSSYRQAEKGQTGGLERTDDIGAREVTLPLYPAMSEAQVDEVVGAVENALGAAGKLNLEKKQRRTGAGLERI